ncbi:hypothetical protein F7230_04595 [Corynebacterium sp. 320]|uniref:hypothetical protein n=1 Tax=Corynebacterium TaxID=1716 RepID=UPI00125CB303|nr:MULTISPECIES: hypothetical protein [Corynebacterium]KAB1504361.1 hypothetical protein F7230_04595 [Corynebacterium sp. 320]KAB1552541.1 hypothetical protein F7233_02005 [Corynebacterium sp. 321]KAB3528497.1 hypothetical protein F8354_04595 [Corynebacterium sp. 250]QNP92038.1 hypothetical protein IAU67_08460 [Corynebacterium zhongnanshanii]
MVTDMDVYTWLDSRVDSSVSREAAESDLAAGEVEQAVFILADEANAAGALTWQMLDTLLKEYPDGWMNEVFSYMKDSNSWKPSAAK